MLSLFSNIIFDTIKRFDLIFCSSVDCIFFCFSLIVKHKKSVPDGCALFKVFILFDIKKALTEMTVLIICQCLFILNSLFPVQQKRTKHIDHSNVLYTFDEIK